MSSYAKLKSQADELMRQAEHLRGQEIAQVISDIRKKMSEHGLTVGDIANRKKVASTHGKKTLADKKVRYRGPNGETWAGGPGRKPRWVRDILSAGGSLESYRQASD